MFLSSSQSGIVYVHTYEIIAQVSIKGMDKKKNSYEYDLFISKSLAHFVFFSNSV